jgi:hypothetical protein
MADIIRILGGILAKKINKSAIASTGLIRLSIKSETKKDGRTADYNDLKLTFENSLADGLKKINVADADQVCREMVIELKKSQSLLTMA